MNGLRKGPLVFVLVLLFIAAAPAQQSITFEVAGISCSTCAQTATKALLTMTGVTNANVAFDAKRASVKASREIAKEEIHAALAKYGFEPRFPGDPVVQPLTATERAGLDIKVALRGEALIGNDIEKIEQLLKRGRE